MLIKDLPSRPNIRFAHAGSVFFAVFGPTTEVQDLDDMLKHERELAAAYGHVSLIALVQVNRTTGKIADDVRKRSVEITQAANDFLRGSATVVIGSGLGVAILRMFMTGFNLMAKTKFPIKVFSTTAEAVAWVHNLPGQTPDAKEVTAEALLSHFGVSEAK